MIKIKSVTMKNFMSVGNVTQGVVLDENPLTLILGENRDLGGSGNRNGVGKSTIINAITYALYGAALTKIRLPNLINKTNGKGMMVSLEFTKGNDTYRIERGRGPEVFKWFVNGVDPYDNDAQGSNKLTQEEVEEILGMNKVLFSNIVALNTFNEPFLSMTTAKQREMMELLLGMTKLSEKAASLKEVIKDTKADLKEEEFRIKGITDSNATIQTNIDSTNEKIKNWDNTHESNIARQAAELEKLDSLDVDAELAKHKEIENIAEIDAERKGIKENISLLEAEVIRVGKEIDKLNKDKERALKNKETALRNKEDQLRNAKNFEESRDGLDDKKKQLIDQLEVLKEAAKNVEHTSTCPTCSQSITGDLHEDLLKDALEKVVKCEQDIEQCDVDFDKYGVSIKSCEVSAKEYEEVASKCDEEMAGYDIDITKCEAEIIEISGGIDALNGNLDAIPAIEKPETFYKTVAEVYEHKNKIGIMIRDLENEMSKVNPYIEQKEVLEGSLQEVDYSEIEKITSIREHQEFLLKLLTNKDSFIRKKIIDQNLSFLNDRLRHYLEVIGLPHSVVFNANLDVFITEYGRDLDFDNLSRGEKTRLILSLSWAFRDVYESMNGNINLLFVDEMLDSGLDTSGTTSTLDALNIMAHEQHKNVMLISHREELVGKVSNIITVCKENGFTRIETSDL